MKRNTFTAALLALASLGVLGTSAQAQTAAPAWPTKPVRIIHGFTSGGPSKIMSNHVLIKGLSILGVRAGETIARIAPELGRDYVEVLPKLAALGVMRPHISHRFPMERAADAFQALTDRQVIGKAVIEMGG